VTVFCPIIGHEHYYAEVLFTEFLVEHNVAFAASEHAGPLFRRMFPDADTARKYGCGRTKIACMIESLAKAIYLLSLLLWSYSF